MSETPKSPELTAENASAEFGRRLAEAEKTAPPQDEIDAFIAEAREKRRKSLGGYE